MNKKYWSGCNYYINRGNHPMEPVGTATSMISCDGCEDEQDCPVKMETETWAHSDDIKRELDKKFYGFIASKNSQLH